MVSRAGLSHERPAFGIDHVMVGNREVAVHEEAVLATPFGTLLHFPKDVDTPQPRVLRRGAAVGPLRHAAARHGETLLADHDVYVTDWHNRAMCRSTAGRSGSTTTSST